MRTKKNMMMKMSQRRRKKTRKIKRIKRRRKTKMVTTSALTLASQTIGRHRAVAGAHPVSRFSQTLLQIWDPGSEEAVTPILEVDGLAQVQNLIIQSRNLSLIMNPRVIIQNLNLIINLKVISNRRVINLQKAIKNLKRRVKKNRKSQPPSIMNLKKNMIRHLQNPKRSLKVKKKRVNLSIVNKNLLPWSDENFSKNTITRKKSNL